MTVCMPAAGGRRTRASIHCANKQTGTTYTRRRYAPHIRTTRQPRNTRSMAGQLSIEQQLTACHWASSTNKHDHYLATPTILRKRNQARHRAVTSLAPSHHSPCLSPLTRSTLSAHALQRVRSPTARSPLRGSTTHPSSPSPPVHRSSPCLLPSTPRHPLGTTHTCHPTSNGRPLGRFSLQREPT